MKQVAGVAEFCSLISERSKPTRVAVAQGVDSNACGHPSSTQRATQAQQLALPEQPTASNDTTTAAPY